MFEFIFCPECGMKLGKANIGDEGEMPFCEACKRPYFKQFPTCVIISVVDENSNIILLKQSYVSKTNHILVAGYIKFGDDAEKTVVKEVLEETGQIVDKLEYIRSYFYDVRGMLMLGFVVFVKRKELTLSREVDEANWYRMDAALELVRKGSIAEKHLLETIKYCNSI